MTVLEVFQVRDGDGWEVYIGNASGGYRLVSSVGGTAVVDTLPDGAVEMVADRSQGEVEELAKAIVAGIDGVEWEDFTPEGQEHKREQARRLIAAGWTRGGDRRG